MGTRPQHELAYRRLRALLRQWRIDAGLTQPELARKLRKRHHTFIQKTESGDRRVDPIEFVRWCKACGVDPRDGIGELDG
ncbi:MAG: helix-turn-helix domain-containing protein [Phycisphaerales bacterium]|nr:helix-turn-helix domain-containing protein [Phycisphaerales bacterium]